MYRKTNFPGKQKNNHNEEAITTDEALKEVKQLEEKKVQKEGNSV